MYKWTLNAYTCAFERVFYSIFSRFILTLDPYMHKKYAKNGYFLSLSDLVLNLIQTFILSSIICFRISSSVTIGKTSPELQGFTSVGPITAETAIAGVQQLYKATITISKGNGFDKSVVGKRFICLTASER